ncbi:MAG: SDR family oxidoreductase [Xanthomonadaceae bacterium]|nr:SDR family oxidoreductase [Xanthomonadaceae bacterium]
MSETPVILITGAGKGIGRATALEFSKWMECDLFLVARTESDLEAVKKECEKWKATVHTHVADLTDENTSHDVIAECVSKFKRIDLLVNNAGVGRFGNFLELTGADLDFTINTNIRGLFHLTQSAYKVMKTQKYGHMIFVTSVAAETPFEQSAIYCMSKFAQKGLIEVLRINARKDGIRITNIMPGAVETPMWGAVTPEMQEKMMKPQDIGSAIIHAYLQPKRTSVEEIVLRPVGGDL